MTPKQADRLIGQTIKVHWPAYNQSATITILSRRSRSPLIEAIDHASPQHKAVFNVHDMVLVS